MLLLLMVSGCAVTTPPEPVTALPYQFSLKFSSTLPELYYVLSGPAYTYGRFPVNRDFSARVQERLARQSQPGAERTAVLEVRLESLETSFEEIGSAPGKRYYHLAESGTFMADTGPMLLAGDFDSDGDFNLPEETTKLATMDLTVRLTRDGALVAEKDLSVSYRETYNWYFDHPAMQNYARYSYEPVLQGLYREALREISRFLEGART